jgi:hypothetical protein
MPFSFLETLITGGIKMNTKLSTNRKFRRMFVNILSIAVILALAFPAVGSVYAQEPALLEGWHDGSDGEVDPNACVAFGWSADPDDRDRDVQIRILSDGEQVAEVLAGDYGEDMDELGICPEGTCRFTVNLWDLISHDEEHEITVQAYDEETADWWNLEGTPKMLTCLTPPPPSPHFYVFPEWDYIIGWEWPAGNFVTAEVYHPGEEEPSCTATVEVAHPEWSNDVYVAEFFPVETCDIQANDYVVLTDGYLSRDHFVFPLQVTMLDQESNTIGGFAEPGIEVQTWIHEEDDTFHTVMPDDDGNWVVDFAPFDLVVNMGGRAEQYDDDGDATSVDWYIPNPHFTVFPEWEWFDGNDWPDGSTVSITVGGKDQCTTEGTSWGYFFNGSFGEGCDLEVGDEVTFTDGETTRTHTVQNLAITKANHEDDTIKGVADPGAEVYVWPHATGEQQLAVAKTKGAAEGKWNVDFSGIFNLTPGECGRSEIRDEDANSTAVDWCIPNPTFVAYMPVTIVGYDWPRGETINLSINDGEYTAQAEVGNADWDPTVVLFELWQDDFTMEAGDHIVMTDEAAYVSKELWVTNLAVTDFDFDAKQVFGNYDPAYDLWTWLYDLEGQVPEIDPDNGTWVATFTELPPGAWGGATQWDGDGDGTSIDFQVPNTRVDIATQPDWVDSGITVSAGQSFTIQAFGLMNPCSDTYPNGADYCIFYTPQGAEGVVPDENEFGVFPGPGLPFMALLGRIGEGEPFYVGAGDTFTAEESGTLWFTPNDNLRTDNQGAYSVLVWLEP